MQHATAFPPAARRPAATPRVLPHAAERRRRNTHRGKGRGGRRLTVLVAILVAAGAVGVVAHGLKPGGSGGTGASAAVRPSASPSTSTAGDAHAPTKSPTATPTPTPSARTSRATDWTKPGSGVFTTAAASGTPVGHGTIRRYKVEVENGTGVSAAGAAKEIEGVLADPRGWTDDGHDGFQLVSSGNADFEIKIASPDTVDDICGAAGLHTHGEVNCDVGSQVVVNLKRWETGSPEFPGSLHDYRALIINHEVGHRIGHGHEGCPGPGKPAPAMMQQIDGLHGCVANAWPYDSQGNYLAGPSVP